MRAEELMIGDWVKHPVYGNLRINELGTTFSSFRNEQIVPTRELEPIPITPEILEKNGFSCSKIKDGESYISLVDPYEYGSYRDFEMCRIEDTNEYILSTNNVEYTIGETFQYVHELQHILRSLFKIDKEIVL